MLAAARERPRGINYTATTPTKLSTEWETRLYFFLSGGEKKVEEGLLLRSLRQYRRYFFHLDLPTLASVGRRLDWHLIAFLCDTRPLFAFKDEWIDSTSWLAAQFWKQNDDKPAKKLFFFGGKLFDNFVCPSCLLLLQLSWFSFTEVAFVFRFLLLCVFGMMNKRATFKELITTFSPQTIPEKKRFNRLNGEIYYCTLLILRSVNLKLKLDFCFFVRVLVSLSFFPLGSEKVFPWPRSIWRNYARNVFHGSTDSLCAHTHARVSERASSGESSFLSIHIHARGRRRRVTAQFSPKEGFARLTGQKLPCPGDSHERQTLALIFGRTDGRTKDERDLILILDNPPKPLGPDSVVFTKGL